MENRIEVHCRMCGYLWPLARRMALPQIIPSGRAVTCCSSHMNGSDLHANGGLHALGAKSYISTFHSGISQWTGRCDFVDVPAKTF